MRHQRVSRLEWREKLERADRRCSHLVLSRAMPFHRDGRSHPHVVYRFDVVRQRLLIGRCYRDEKTRVVATWCADRCDPVAEVRQPISREAQVLALEHCRELVLTCVELASIFLVTLEMLPIAGIDELPVLAIREQYA